MKRESERWTDEERTSERENERMNERTNKQSAHALLRYANTIADACSAALPTIGTTIAEMKIDGTPQPSAAPSSAPTSAFESAEMKTVMTPSQKSEPRKPSTSSS